MKNFNREAIQRMFDGRKGGGGGGTNNADLAGYATQMWVNQNYVSIEFFNRLFSVHGHDPEDESTPPTDISVLPNDMDSIVDSIESMVGFYTEEYLSALGLNPDSGSGNATTLYELLDVKPNSDVSPSRVYGLEGTSADNGKLLTYSTTYGKWIAAANGAGSGSVTSIDMTVPTGFSVSGAPITTYGTLAITFGGSIAKNKVLASPSNATGSPDWRTLVASDIPDLSATYASASDVTTLQGYFDNLGNANSANKLAVYSKTAWGQTYWTSGGVPDNISGDMSSVGDITASSNGTKDIKGFRCLEMYGAASSNFGGYIDFHYNNDSGDYTSRIIEDASCVLKINNTIWATLSGDVGVGTSTTYTKLTVNGGVKTTKLYLYKPNTANDTNAVYFEYDSANAGVHLVGAGFYGNSYISAIGLNSQGGGGSITLNEPLNGINNAGLSAPTSSVAGQTVVWNGSAWTYSINTTLMAGKLASAGSVTANGYSVTGKDNTYVLLAGGGTKLLSEIGGGSYLPLSGGTLTGVLTVNPTHQSGIQDGIVLNDRGVGSGEALRIVWTSASYERRLWLLAEPATKRLYYHDSDDLRTILHSGNYNAWIDDIYRYYYLNLESLSTSNFYPVIFNPRWNANYTPENMELDCEIHSHGYGESSAYNQNMIHFLLTASGWSDTPKRFIVLSNGNYSDSEITIGSIGYGTAGGYKKCVWLRGGLSYRVKSNYEPSVKTSNATYGTEVYTVGTNLYGGSNQNVSIVWKNDSTRNNSTVATAGGTTGSFLPLSGGTLTGDLNLTNSNIYVYGNPGTHQQVNIIGSDYAIGMAIGGGNTNRGFYDSKLNKWLLYFDANDTIVNNGALKCNNYLYARECISLTRENWNYICVPSNNGTLAFNVGEADTANTKMVILNSGNVGIGKNDPSYALDVGGIVRSSNGFIKVGGTSSQLLTANGGTISNGELTARYFNVLANEDWNRSANSGVLFLHAYGDSDVSVTHAPNKYYFGVSFNGYGGFQLATFNEYRNLGLAFRKWSDNNTWSGWRYVVFSDDTIANATYATTAGSANGLANGVTISGTTSVDNGLYTNNTSRKVLFGTGSSGNSGIWVENFGWLVALNTNGNAVLNGNATTATTLQTQRTLWGQQFNGSGNVSGSITSTGDITPASNLNYNIGSSVLRYANAYIDKLYIGNNFISGESASYLTLGYSGNEMIICGGKSQVHVNYRGYSGKYAASHYMWHSGNGTSWAKHEFGELVSHSNGTFAGYLTGVTNIDSLLYFDTTNSRIGVGVSAPDYGIDAIGGMRLRNSTSGTGSFNCGVFSDSNNPYIRMIDLNGSSVDIKIATVTSSQGNTTYPLSIGDIYRQTRIIGQNVRIYSRVDASSTQQTPAIITTYGGRVIIGSDTTLHTNNADCRMSVSGSLCTAEDDGTFIKIGQIYIGYDSSNTALKVYKKDSNNNIIAANFYATGAVSALGANTSSGGAGDYIPLSGSTAITGSLVPATINTYDLGSSTKAWGTIYCNAISGNASLSVQNVSCTTFSTSARAVISSGAKFYSIYIESDSSGNVSSSHSGEINRDSADVHLQYASGTGGVTMCRQGFRFATSTDGGGNNLSTISTSNRSLRIELGTATLNPYISKPWNEGSDIRRKDIIANVSASIESIADAPIFNFRYKGDLAECVNLGTSAQYWRNVFPCGVTEMGDGYLAMSYGSIALAAAVVTARKVQNHEDRIRELEERLSLSEAENKALREEIELLKAA